MGEHKPTRTELDAYHEAGHVVAHLIMNIPFQYVTIKKGADNRGHVACLNEPPTDDDHPIPFEEYYQGFRGDFIAVAGIVSAKIFKTKTRRWNLTLSDYLGAVTDSEMILERSKALENIYSSDCFNRNKWFINLCENAKALLYEEESLAQIKAIAAGLLEHETLSYQEVLTIANEEVSNHNNQ